MLWSSTSLERVLSSLFEASDPPDLRSPRLLVPATLLLALFAPSIISTIRAWCSRIWRWRPDRPIRPRNQELPRNYSFSTCVATRAREPTHLSFLAPTPPDARSVQPLILRVFDRPDGSASGRPQTYLRSALRPGNATLTRTPTPHPSGPRFATAQTSNTVRFAEQLGDPLEASTSIVPTNIHNASVTPVAPPQSRRSPSPAPVSWFKQPKTEFDISNPPESAYVRHWKAFKGHAGITSESEEGGTFWFQSESQTKIAHPPDFSACPQVRMGDIYCHRTGNHCQMWLHSLDDDGSPSWLSVEAGYLRVDGRRLIVTDTMRSPSWVSEATFNMKFKRRLHQM